MRSILASEMDDLIEQIENYNVFNNYIQNLNILDDGEDEKYNDIYYEKTGTLTVLNKYINYIIDDDFYSYYCVSPGGNSFVIPEKDYIYAEPGDYFFLIFTYDNDKEIKLLIQIHSIKNEDYKRHYYFSCLNYTSELRQEYVDVFGPYSSTGRTIKVKLIKINDENIVEREKVIPKYDEYDEYDDEEVGCG